MGSKSASSRPWSRSGTPSNFARHQGQGSRIGKSGRRGGGIQRSWHNSRSRWTSYATDRHSLWSIHARGHGLSKNPGLRHPSSYRKGPFRLQGSQNPAPCIPGSGATSHGKRSTSRCSSACSLHSGTCTGRGLSTRCYIGSPSYWCSHPVRARHIRTVHHSSPSSSCPTNYSIARCRRRSRWPRRSTSLNPDTCGCHCSCRLLRRSSPASSSSCTSVNYVVSQVFSS